MTATAPAPAGLLIPRILHRIWLGGAPIPEQFEAHWRSWAEHHPGWELRTWTDDTLPPLRNQALFDVAPSLAQKADVARYELLAQHGGIYVDCDFECLKNVEPLLDGVEAFAGWENDVNISNALMGCRPGHPFVAALVEHLPDRVAALPGAPPNEQTGPRLVTELLQSGAIDADVTIFPTGVFYPYGYHEQHRRGETFPDAYAVHHWAHSWAGQAGAGAETGGPQLRFGVVLDPQDPRGAREALALWARLFRAGDPVELALIARGPADEAAAAHAQELVAEAVAEGGDLAEIVLYGLEEATRLRLDAVVGTHDDDPVAAARETAAALEAVAKAAAQLRAPAPAPAATATAPAAPARQPATFLGNNRLLVPTAWGGRILAIADDLSLTPDLVTYGVYDPSFVAFLERILRPGDHVADIGANIGLFTVRMAELVGRAGRVSAFEPDPDVFEVLTQNVELNYFDWVHLRNVAVGAQDGEATLSRTMRFRGNSSIVGKDEGYAARYSSDAVQELAVPVVRAATVLGAAQGLRFVKVDVEGAEPLVLDGLKPLLEAGKVEYLDLECVEANAPAQWPALVAHLDDLVHRLGARLHAIATDGTLHPIPLELLVAHKTLHHVVVAFDAA